MCVCVCVCAFVHFLEKIKLEKQGVFSIRCRDIIFPLLAGASDRAPDDEGGVEGRAVNKR